MWCGTFITKEGEDEQKWERFSLLGWAWGCERVREQTPSLKMPAEQGVWGGYLKEWLATCDDMEPPGEVGELNFQEPSMGEEPLGKEAGEVGRGRQITPFHARELGLFSCKWRETIEWFNQGNNIISPGLCKSHFGGMYGGGNIWVGCSSGDQETS